ncbi:unnamed protein product [Symbiodinium microadriaticum]|nr:unnamed protein product [Symbiodinium microadriaticum]CAE7544276.1 unnamed protein product [Symbiodinium sp. KB8]
MALLLREADAMPPAERQACWLAGVAARRLERHLDQELRGELVLLYGAEARATDVGFYLLHLVQLPLLRTGRYALVAALIAPWLHLDKLRNSRPVPGLSCVWRLACRGGLPGSPAGHYTATRL